MEMNNDIFTAYFIIFLLGGLRIISDEWRV